eukprot:TRINITY_DN2328_c0_g1_i2.p1 TRINITY_DN2328_c0_g1~~TRINITY_DN2328_c0_g1_i2.p1  ORF type:complete len:520 (-),score=147.77 TRINITY_DN2328_c0_g1_i2:27-1586(-)
MGYSNSNNQLSIVMEYLECFGDALLDTEKNKFSLYERIVYANQVAEGMAWLHGAKIVHCDLKPSNILWDRNKKSIKISDFGLAVPVTNVTHTGGSKNYIPPEVFKLRKKYLQEKDESYLFSRDVYAYGVTILQFITRERPFFEESFEDSYELKEAVVNGERPFFPFNEFYCPTSIYQLIHECWNEDPFLRPSFEDILESFVDDFLVDSSIFEFNQNENKNKKNFRINHHDSDDDHHNDSDSDKDGKKNLNRFISDLTNPEIYPARHFWKFYFGTRKDDFEKFFNDDKNSNKTNRNNNNNKNEGENDGEKKAFRVRKRDIRNNVASNRFSSLLSTVPLDQFLVSLQAYLKVSNDDLPCLSPIVKFLFCKNNNVTLNDFGNMIGFFVPLDSKWLKKVIKILNSPWYFGKISREEAFNFLKGKSKRDFLLRFSSTEDYNWVLSYVQSQNKILHLRIVHRYSSNTFSLERDNGENNIEFKSLHKLVDYFRKHKVISKPVSNLSNPSSFLFVDDYYDLGYGSFN